MNSGTTKRNIAAAKQAERLSRQAKLSTCASCGRSIIRGLDGDRCAMLAEVDANELDEAGELLALMRGKATFDLTRLGGVFELNYRNAGHIKQPRLYPVYAEHDCAYTYPVKAEPHELLVRAGLGTQPLPDQPPF